MHRTLTTPNTLHLGQIIANPPYVVDYDDVYETVAEHIAGCDDHLAELVQLFITLNRRGVRLEDHLDCIVEALILEELQ